MAYEISLEEKLRNTLVELMEADYSKKKQDHPPFDFEAAVRRIVCNKNFRVLFFTAALAAEALAIGKLSSIAYDTVKISFANKKQTAEQKPVFTYSGLFESVKKDFSSGRYGNVHENLKVLKKSKNEHFVSDVVSWERNVYIPFITELERREAVFASLQDDVQNERYSAANQKAKELADVLRNDHSDQSKELLSRLNSLNYEKKVYVPEETIFHPPSKPTNVGEGITKVAETGFSLMGDVLAAPLRVLSKHNGKQLDYTKEALFGTNQVKPAHYRIVRVNPASGNETVIRDNIPVGK